MNYKNKECYVSMGGSQPNKLFFVKTKVMEFIPSKIIENYTKEMALRGYTIPEKWEMFYEEATVLVEGLDYPIPGDRVFFDLPFNGREFEMGGDIYILNPIEKYQGIRMPIKEAKKIKGFLLEKTIHFQGNAGSIQLFFEWHHKPLAGNTLCMYTKKDMRWEEAYSQFAKQLATMRP